MNNRQKAKHWKQMYNRIAYNKFAPAIIQSNHEVDTLIYEKIVPYDSPYREHIEDWIILDIVKGLSEKSGKYIEVESHLDINTGMISYVAKIKVVRK